MAVLLDTSTRLLVQGLTGREGTFHAKAAAAYGTTIVGGVTPGKGGLTHEGWPVFNTMHDAVAATNANASLVFVPPAAAADTVMEAVDAGVGLVVCITEGIPDPRHDARHDVHARQANEAHRAELPGADFPGQGEGGHHPGPHLPRRAHRHRFAQRNAHLRGDPADHAAGLRADDVHRHRRRPDHRHDLRRRASPVQRGPGHRGRRDDRGDRRHVRKRKRPISSGASSRSRSSASSRARPLLRDGEWGTRAPSSPAGRALRRRRWPRSRRRA